MVYRWQHLATAEATWESLWRQVTEQVPPDRLWGAFAGLFGLATSELFVVTMADGVPPAVEDASGCSIVDELLLSPTIRPDRAAPLSRDGLYVFRFFELDPANVPDVVRLSGEAWGHFEGSADYAARPEALFAPEGTAANPSRMLLVTWYDSLASWQTSRAPARDAADLFRQRQALVARSLPYATRLLKR